MNETFEEVREFEGMNFFSKTSQQKSRAMTAAEKKVLLLGAGMVSDPLAYYFSLQPKVQLTVAADSHRDGQRLASIGNNIDSVVVDVNKDPSMVDELIKYKCTT